MKRDINISIALLCKIVITEDIAHDKKNEAKILDMNSILKSKNRC